MRRTTPPPPRRSPITLFFLPIRLPPRPPADTVYGPALSAMQLNATANVPGTFTYTPALGTVLNAGSHELSVTFTPEDATNYTAATATVTINVTKAAAKIAWPRPADVPYGSA